MAEQNQGQENIEEHPVEIPVVWGSAEHLPTSYANHLYVIHSEGEFFIVFGEATPLPGFPRGDLPDKVEIRPLVKIAVAPERMKEFVRVINANFERYQARKTEQSEDSDDS